VGIAASGSSLSFGEGGCCEVGIVVGIAAILLGSSGYILGAPIVHGMHRQTGMVGADILLRLFSPILVTLGGDAIGGCFSANTGSGCTIGGVTGLALGLLTPVVLDAAVFAYEPEGTPAPPSGFTHPVSLTLVPITTVIRDSGGYERPVIGLGGAF